MVGGNSDESRLLERAVEILNERLPRAWVVEQTDGQGAGEGAGDALFAFSTITGLATTGNTLVVAKPDFRPADVERLLGGLTRRLLDATPTWPILLVSDYLSPRARELLAREDINYLDLTGNTRIVMDTPGLFVETSGASRRPRERGAGRETGLRGAKVGRIVRFLTEVAPPYGVNDIENATRVSRGYVSRIVDRLADEALVDREPRGPIEGVDWPALLRRRGEVVDLFRANTSRTYVAPNGAHAVFDGLSARPVGRELVVTGSFAAVQIAPIASPTLLVLYLVPGGSGPRFDDVADRLGLLPADEGADVALLWPANERLVEEFRTVDGVAVVNLPQLVVDCLGGTGRMPAEGEAVLEWMQANERAWRHPSLDEYLASDARDR